MVITKEYVESIRPATDGVSDKYSWNIYRYLKYYIGENFVVCQGAADGLLVGQFYPDDFYGNSLRSLMCEYTTERYSWDKRLEVLPVTSFFGDYRRIGRCLLIPHDYPWYEGENTRFTYVGNTRRCNWCGKWQHKEIHKQVVMTRDEVWRDD